jgi:hypothetical protein
VVADGVAGTAGFEALPWVPSRIELGREQFAISADGRSTAILDVRAFDDRNRLLDHLEPEVRASAGRIRSVSPLEEGGYRIRYDAPTWRYDAFRRRGPAPTREESLRVRIGGLEAEAVVLLTAMAEDAALPKFYLEAGAAYRDNLGVLGGAGASVHGGVYLMHRPRLSLLGGVVSGFSDQRGGFEVTGPVEGTAWARVRITTVPILAAFSAELPAGGWRIGAGLGGGVVVAPGAVRIPMGPEVSVSATVPAGAARLFVGRRVGPGFLVADVSYLYAERSAHRGGIDVVGSLGGVGGSVGYRVER